MPRRIQRAVMHPIEINTLDDLSPFDVPYDVVEEWVPEPPVDRWSEWRTVDSGDGAYRTEVFYRSLFQVDHIATYQVRWFEEERTLIRSWVDRVEGPMAMSVRTETRTIYA